MTPLKLTPFQHFYIKLGITRGQARRLMVLVNAAEKAQEAWHNGDGNRDTNEATANAAVAAVEAYAKRVCPNATLQWPGLFPIFILPTGTVEIPG